MDEISITMAEAYALAFDALQSNGFSAEHADAIARNVVRCQRDECRSHGLYRVLVCIRTLKAGKVSPDAAPTISQPAPGIVKVDAHDAYSLLAFEAGRGALVDRAKENGVAAMAINRCFHFSALWPEMEDLAANGVAALAMLPSFSYVAPAGGSRPVLGTNPLAFAWPRRKGEPYVFDFATSAVARGEIELHARAGRPIPEGWAVDGAGRPTTDARTALDGAMLTFGGHKGSALSTMIELLAGPLIGDLTSAAALAHADGADATPYHGELLLAFDPARFGFDDSPENERRAEDLFAAFADQGARLPSSRRHEARRRSDASGTVSLPRGLRDEIAAATKGSLSCQW